MLVETGAFLRDVAEIAALVVAVHQGQAHAEVVVELYSSR